MASLPAASVVDNDVLAKKHTDWAAFNTRFASERTMMAVLRTSLSLISFGFTIYKVFESVIHSMGDASPFRFKGPRRFGMTLVGIGLFVLIAGGWQHWLFLRELKREANVPFPWSVSLVAAFLLTITGIVVFVLILVRM